VLYEQLALEIAGDESIEEISKTGWVGIAAE
jgi:hypothetical protein